MKIALKHPKNLDISNARRAPTLEMP